MLSLVLSDIMCYFSEPSKDYFIFFIFYLYFFDKVVLGAMPNL